MAEMMVWEGRWGLGWVSSGVKIRPPLPWTDRQRFVNVHGRVKSTEVNSLIPRLHLVCMSPSSIEKSAILKVIRTGVGSGSGTKSRQ